MTSPEFTVRDAVINLLDHFGLQTVFGNPGSTELPMFRNFPSHFRYILGLQESVVIGMADGYAQATRNAAFVNLHSAAGLGHGLGNIFTAYKNQTPLVILAGQQARSIMAYDPFLYAERATEFPRPYVKWAIEPARAQDVPAAIARAYHIAMQAPRGPVFVSVPVDDWDRPCPSLVITTVAQQTRGDAVMLAEIAQALAAAKAPAFVIGAGVARDDAWHEVIALAERHTAAVWTAPMAARNGFPENHALFAGFLPAAREAIVARLTGHDVILVLGAPAFTYHIEGHGPHLPEHCRAYMLVDDPAQAAWSPAHLSVVTHLKAGIADVLAGPAPAPRAAPPRRKSTEPLSGLPFTDAYVLQRIAALRPANSVVVEEAPSSRDAMHDHLPITARDGFYTCASGGLGHGLPAAIGVALARPDTRVIALLGDGSAMYAIQGLWTAAQLKLPMCFIILNNRRYQALIGFGDHFGLAKTVGTLLPDIDFVALAKGQGLAAARADSATTLDDALRDAFNATGPCLLEVVIA
jgi:benzoylformate decarboxylase